MNTKTLTEIVRLTHLASYNDEDIAKMNVLNNKGKLTKEESIYYKNNFYQKREDLRRQMTDLTGIDEQEISFII